MDQRDVGGRQIERRKGLIQLADKRGNVARVVRQLLACRRALRFPGAENRVFAPRDQEQMAAERGAPAERLVTGIAPRDEIQGFQHRDAARQTERLDKPIDRGSGGVDRDARADLDLATAHRVARPHPHDAPPVGGTGQRRDGLDVIRERGPVARRRERKRKRQAIGFRRDVIVEDRRAGQPLAPQAGEALHRGGAADDAPGREPQRRLDAAVAIGGGEPVDEKAAAHYQLAVQDRSIDRQRKGQRPHTVGRDARQRPALADRLAGTRQVQLLQVAQAAVDRAQVIERGAAAEIVALDQRHRQTALRRIVGDRQSADPAPDDEDVEGGRGQAIEISNHGCGPGPSGSPWFRL